MTTRGEHGLDAPESFYDAQRRHRRSGRRFSALAAAAVVLLGVPLSLVVTPLVVGAGLIGVDVANLAVPLPDPVGEIGDRVGALLDDDARADAGVTAGRRPSRERAAITPGEAGVAAVLLVVPGIAVMGVTWLGVRRVLRRAGAGAVVLAAGGRPPRPGDLEERQLVHLVEEMALAAGVPPPGVAVLDSPDANLLVAGRSMEDATLVVPRGLLVELGRAPTGALVGSMLAVVVDGDLRAATSIAATYQTLDLVAAVLAAPYSRATRRTLRRVARVALRPGRAGGGTPAHVVAGELAALATLGAPDEGSGTGCVTAVLQLPFLVASIAFALTRAVAGGLLVTPVAAARWRRRRLLADATAVELTRDPDALARALEHLLARGVTVPAGPWTHLCAVGPELGHERARRLFAQRGAEVRRAVRRPGESRTAALVRRWRQALGASRALGRGMDATDGGDAGHPPAEGDLAAFLPPPGVRLDRLRAMGARLGRDPSSAPVPPRGGVVGTVVGSTVGIVLGVVLVVALAGLCACVAALIGLAVLLELTLVVPLVAGVHALVR